MGCNPTVNSTVITAFLVVPESTRSESNTGSCPFASGFEPCSESKHVHQSEARVSYLPQSESESRNGEGVKDTYEPCTGESPVIEEEVGVRAEAETRTGEERIDETLYLINSAKATSKQHSLDEEIFGDEEKGVTGRNGRIDSELDSAGHDENVEDGIE
ncbi:hypothetical protein PIB30_065297 [Stylosanthes scabra]|uniref:Uncharacterized protein n=1 Tax=Stylosanthes scabra TaxID=79078 RepID=A0ABU6SLY1_9FABA|nr:hypothetical protein [Stylosanthes scabra]